MNVRLYREYGSLNSSPVFDAFEEGAKSLGWDVNDPEGIPVIWSVLWAGRMAPNQRVYQDAKNKNKPVIILEVGNLKRNDTWRISLDNINGNGHFGDSISLDFSRPRKLGLSLQPPKTKRRREILIATQHQQSHQWKGMPRMDTWAKDTVNHLRQYTDRQIIVRPHPRSPFRTNIPGATLLFPKRIAGSYDDFDIDYNFHCVINYNSGPAVQAAISGTPIICDSSSLAWPVSDSIENIENISLPDREEWFLKLCHTEWTLNEIKTGEPLKRLLIKKS